jgi:hypothetical protein
MIDINKIVELSETIEIDETESLGEGTTPYGVWKVLTEVLRKVGIPTDKVTPQMMYNYAKNGRIDGKKGSKRYSDETVEAFVAKFVARKMANK